VISLGPQTAIYRFLHEHVVLVRSVRALSRFSLLPVLVLCVLTGLALSGRRRLAWVALALGLAEASLVPLGYARYAGPPASAHWLAGREGAVVYLPLGSDDTQAMLDGVAYFRPLVNGDSGFVPRPYTRAMELLAESPLSEDARWLLQALEVRQVVSREPQPLPVLAQFGEERIYGLAAGAPLAPASTLGDFAPTLWSPEGTALDLGTARTVSGVAFEVSDAPWVARPRVTLSVDGRQWQAVSATASLAEATLSLYRDPRHGLGFVRFAPATARLVRLDAGLPARPGALRPLVSP
jgi:hypothetical protein